MNIDSKIAEVCQRIKGITYHFNDWTRANVDLDRVSMPVLINILPIKGGTILKNGKVRETRNAVFGMLDISGNDDTAEEDIATVQRMREFKLKLLIAINNSGYFEPIEGEVSDEVSKDTLDVNVTGVVFEIKLIEKNGTCY